MDRCTGHCCRKFYLSKSHDEMATVRDAVLTTPLERLGEEAQMSLLVLPLPDDEVHGLAGLRGHLYTCRGFDRVSGNCLIYEDRPPTCRTYPYGTQCQYEECTSFEASCLHVRVATIRENGQVHWVGGYAAEQQGEML